jgi:anion-transporting  ArsA/GET3 family ATPase
LTEALISQALSEAWQKELQVTKIDAIEVNVGQWRLSGGMLGDHVGWLLEMSKLQGPKYPLMSVFSAKFSKDPIKIYTQLVQAGYRILVGYIAQQIVKWRNDWEKFTMQNIDTDIEFAQAMRDLLRVASEEELRAAFGPETLAKVLTPEERLKGLAAEERLKGLSPEERLKGLSPEEIAKLRQMLGSQD